MEATEALQDPRLSQAFELLRNTRDGDIYRLLAGPQAEPKDLLSPHSAQYLPEALATKIFQQMRTLDRIVQSYKKATDFEKAA